MLKVVVVMVVLLSSLVACVQQLKSHCWNDAIYAYGSALSSGYEAKMYIQDVGRSSDGVYHAQAAALIDGKWQWLNVRH